MFVSVVCVTVQRLGLLLANGDEREAEILALRRQVLVVRRQVDRPRFTGTVVRQRDETTRSPVAWDQITSDDEDLEGWVRCGFR